MRIYVQRHTPQKGMSLILDTVLQLRGHATHIPIVARKSLESKKRKKKKNTHPNWVR